MNSPIVKFSLQWRTLLQEDQMASTNFSASCYFLPSNSVISHSSAAIDLFTAVANALFSFITVCGNAFVIVVIWRRRARCVPYNVLLGCLALSDLVVGIVSQPSLAISKIMEMEQKAFSTTCAVKLVQVCSGWLTAGVSLHILCAISLDRYLALRLHMRYAAVVTVARVLYVIVAIWVFSAAGIAWRFFMFDDRHWMLFGCSLLVENIILVLLFDGQVFRTLRRHRRQIHARLQLAQYFHGRSAFEAARHRRSAVTILYVLGAVILCYLPFAATIVVDVALGYTVGVQIAYDLSTTVVFLSSTVNPILYCWRISEIRKAACKTLTRVKSFIPKSETQF